MTNPTEKSLLYTPSEYDNNLALKLSLSAWLIIAFIMRPFVVFVASVSNKSDRFGLLNIVYPDHIWALFSAGASIPTIVLLVAWMKREPQAGQRVRRVWRQGRGLLAISLLLNAGAFVAPWLLGFKLSNIDVAQISICGVLLYVLWRSSRLRDTFAEFPENSTTATKNTPSS